MNTQTNFQAANGGKRALGKHAGFQSEEEQPATKPAHTPPLMANQFQDWFYLAGKPPEALTPREKSRLHYYLETQEERKESAK